MRNNLLRTRPFRMPQALFQIKPNLLLLDIDCLGLSPIGLLPQLQIPSPELAFSRNISHEAPAPICLRIAAEPKKMNCAEMRASQSCANSLHCFAIDVPGGGHRYSRSHFPPRP